MQSVLVIGLGRFGSNLATRLSELGNEVMVIDRSEEAVNKLAPHATAAQIGDCTDGEVLRALGIPNFELCFVCISGDLQSSLEITSLLKELGAARVISKTDSEIHAKFLRKIGADDIIYPERDMAQRAAVRYSVPHALDYVELTPEYAIFELLTPKEWEGKTLEQVDVRTRCHVNVIGAKEKGKVTPIVTGDFLFQPGAHILIAGNKEDVLRLSDRKQ